MTLTQPSDSANPMSDCQRAATLLTAAIVVLEEPDLAGAQDIDSVETAINLITMARDAINLIEAFADQGTGHE